MAVRSAKEGAPASLSAIEYTLSMPRPQSHLFHVEMRIPNAPRSLVVRMPTWTPGSYLVREFARHVEDLRVTGGRARRIDKSGWRIVGRGGDVVVRYKVYAHELSVQTSHLDASHGYLNGTSVFLYAEGRLDGEHRVRVEAPDGWRVDTGLPRRAGAYVAESYDHLADCPFEIGTHRARLFTARGRPHRVALWGRGNEDLDRIVKDLKAIVLETSAVFGGKVPYDDYVFIVHLTSGGKEWGGLEHRNSTTLLAPRFTFKPDREYERFLGLAAHEYFHTWNVKRIKPAAFMPYDWDREVYTKLLWAMEGLTSYYDQLLVTRAGLRSEARHREELADLWKKLVEQPGREKQSLEDSSLTTWVKFYRQDEHYVNSGISYYLKGELLGCALDLAIRDATDGRRSLDDVMRFLWERYGSRGVGLPEDGVEPALEAVTGRRWREWFERYVEGTEDPPLARVLAKVGWELKPVHKGREKDGKPEKPEEATGPGAWLGALAENKSGRLVATSVLAASPAERIGVAPGDELLALDGLRLSEDALKKRLAEATPGRRVDLTVFRRDELLTLRGPLGERPPEKWKVEEAAKPSARAKRLRRGWLSPQERRR